MWLNMSVYVCVCMCLRVCLQVSYVLYVPIRVYKCDSSNVTRFHSIISSINNWRHSTAKPLNVTFVLCLVLWCGVVGVMAGVVVWCYGCYGIVLWFVLWSVIRMSHLRHIPPSS